MSRRLWATACIALTVLLAGCASPAPVATVVPTRTPRPTFTPLPPETPTTAPTVAAKPTDAPVAPAATLAPTQAPAPTQAATAAPTTPPEPTTPPQPSKPVASPSLNAVNVRSGPGTLYPVVGSLSAGQEVDLVGQNNGWWKFCCVAGGEAWVSGEVVNESGPTANVPFAAAPPPPVVVVPTQRPQPTRPPQPTTPPQPTAPPAPAFKYGVINRSSSPNCGSTVIEGTVYKRGATSANDGQPDAYVQVWSYGNKQPVYKTYAGNPSGPGFFSVVLRSPGMIALADLKVAVVDAQGNLLSEQVSVFTDADPNTCASTGHNHWSIDFREN